MPSTIQLIVGLGNPGAEYESTRHNAGAWFVSNIIRKYHGNFRAQAKFFGLYAGLSIEGVDCHFLIPTTFMNLSGQAVKAISQFYKIPPENILIAHDEIDLPAGVIRLKEGGGHGGHNGLRDIIEKMGTPHFYRLRIGVGHPGNSDDVIDYVLEKPSKHDRQEIDFSLQRAQSVFSLVLAGEFQKAMNTLHTENKSNES